MKEKKKWAHVVFIIGVVALILGAVDPLEGSVLILAGIILVAISSYIKNDRHRKIFLTLMIMIAFGVFFLFYLSSLGGFGGSSILSWWWGILILPYPIAWLTSIILLIYRAFKKPK